MKNKKQKNSPDGWQQVKLGDVCDISAGGTPLTNKEEFWLDGDIPWANSAEINKKDIYHVENFISQKGLDNSSAKIVPVNSVLIALAGQGSTRGKVAVNKISLTTNQSIAFFISKGEVNYNFLRSDLERRYRELRSISAGDGGRGGLNLQILKSLKIKLPPLPEQNRIVAVLEVWDGAIEKLVQKIEIKKQIKKGLMQDLLTGKKRLSGFKDKWEIIMLGDICKIETGKKDVNEGNPNGKYPFFTCAKEYTYSDNYSFDTEAILIAGNGEVGNCLYYKGRFEAYQRTYVLSDFKKKSMYIYSYLKYFFQNIINSQKQMGAMPYIKLGMLQEFEIRTPKDLKEQTAIATILTTADQEIAGFEKKLSIIKDQKKYLLNNLITGAIRTVNPVK